MRRSKKLEAIKLEKAIEEQVKKTPQHVWIPWGREKQIDCPKSTRWRCETCGILSTAPVPHLASCRIYVPPPKPKR